MIEEQIAFDAAEAAVKKGERTRILFEILLAEIGCTFENTNVEVWNRLKQVQEEYYEAVKMMSEIIKANGRKAQQEWAKNEKTD